MNQYTWSSLAVGLRHEFRATVTDSMMQNFLIMSGDTNPLHVDPEYARRKGFNGPVVYGLLTSSFYSTLVGVHLPGKYCLLHGIEVSFLSPVQVGDDLVVSGEITYLNEAYRQAQINASIFRVDGTKVSKAKIKLGLLHEDDCYEQ